VPRHYPAEFRRKVLDLVETGRPVAQVAHDLDISAQCICTWRKQQLIDRGQVPGMTSTDHAELVAARKRIAEADRGRGGHCGADPLSPPGAVQAQFGHQPFHRAPGHWRALAVQRQPDLPRPIDREVVLVDPADRGLEPLISRCPGRWCAAGSVVVGGRGDLQAVFCQNAADRLDPEPVPMLADEAHEGVNRPGVSASDESTLRCALLLFRRSAMEGLRSRNRGF
jgi:hypothetical protein